VKESLDELAQRLRQAETPTDKERLQVLYWLKQENAPSISAIAKPLASIATRCKPGCRCTEPGSRSNVGNQEIVWRSACHSAMGRSCISTSAPRARAWVQKLRTSAAVAETLGVEAEYHAVYQMTRYRLKANLKVARPQNSKQDCRQRHIKKNLVFDLELLSQYYRQVQQDQRPMRYFVQDESRLVSRQS